jgi:hemerythrin-like domain-containing protein
MIQIGAKPDSGFDDPIGMLTDCHRRIEHFLRILCVVAERVSGRPLTAEEKSAVNAAMEYFHLGGNRHNADEEESLFPRLRTALEPATIDKINSLEIDHRAGDRLHASIDELYRNWMTRGSLTEHEMEQLVLATHELEQIYQAHIALEEDVIFKRAAELLDSTAISAMGEEFRRRRA